jgi:hypothetical protein
MPRTRFGVIVALLWVRLLLRLRGLGYVARQAKDVPTGDLTRVDVCWSASCTLNYADALTGALFQARHLLLALRAGERLRVTRALAIEAGFAGAVGPSAWPRVVRTLALAREAASGCTGPYAGAIVSACEGIALVMNFRFADAVPRLESAIATFRDHCPGSDWEAATARQFLFFAQFFTSRFRELLDAQEIALKDAVERGDRYAMVMIRVGMPNRNWLVFGDPVRARRELDAGLRDWPSQPFQIMHFYALVADSYIALYQGDHERAAERIRATRRDVRRSMLLTLMGPRLDYASICGHVALARAAAEVRVGKKPDLREVDRCIRVFGRPTSAVIASGVLSMRASRAILAGDRERALALLDELARLDSEDTWLIANCARWIRGAMRGGPEGEASAREAVDELDGRGVRVGIPVIATQLPGFEPYVSEGSAAPSP